MERTTGLLDLATQAACRALASWQALTAVPAPAGPPPGDAALDEPSPDRRAA